MLEGSLQSTFAKTSARDVKTHTTKTLTAKLAAWPRQRRGRRLTTAWLPPQLHTCRYYAELVRAIYIGLLVEKPASFQSMSLCHSRWHIPSRLVTATSQCCFTGAAAGLFDSEVTCMTCLYQQYAPISINLVSLRRFIETHHFCRLLRRT